MSKRQKPFRKKVKDFLEGCAAFGFIIGALGIWAATQGKEDAGMAIFVGAAVCIVAGYFSSLIKPRVITRGASAVSQHKEW